MNRLTRGLLAAFLGSSILATPDGAAAQDGCDGAMQGVDLAVQNARLRQREEGWVVLYTVVNRGEMASTTYHVGLVMDGATVGEPDDYDVGLEPGHRRRWELPLPEDQPTPDGHEIAVRVSTGGPETAAGPSYTDECGANDMMPASQRNPPIQSESLERDVSA